LRLGDRHDLVADGYSGWGMTTWPSRTMATMVDSRAVIARTPGGRPPTIPPAGSARPGPPRSGPASAAGPRHPPSPSSHSKPPAWNVTPPRGRKHPTGPSAKSHAIPSYDLGRAVDGRSEPILFPSCSVNHTLLSEPAAMPVGK